MINVNKTYWFNLLPDVYSNVKRNKIFLYNTINGNSILKEDEYLCILLEELNKDENYGSILIDNNILKSEIALSFFNEIIDKQMGNIVLVEEGTKKVISPRPIFRIDNDIEKVIRTGNHYKGSILNNLLDINLYINNNCSINCDKCKVFANQTKCCKIHSEDSNMLSESQIRSIISQIRYSPVENINILGGNIFEYPYLDFLFSEIQGIGKRAAIWTHYLNLSKRVNIYKNTKINIIVPVSFVETDSLNFDDYFFSGKQTFHFLVENEIDVKHAELLVTINNIDNYQFHPIFNGSNLSFLEKNVFISREDIFHKIFSLQDIFTHQKINTNNFGSLTILPNGDVKTNMNTLVIGNIDNQSILNMIYSELVENSSWRKIRSNEPCSTCLFQFICPSPSNLEFFLEKDNLCHAYE